MDVIRSAERIRRRDRVRDKKLKELYVENNILWTCIKNAERVLQDEQWNSSLQRNKERIVLRPSLKVSRSVRQLCERAE